MGGGWLGHSSGSKRGVPNAQRGRHASRLFLYKFRYVLVKVFPELIKFTTES